MKLERFLGLDIETTGLNIAKHGLIQIGVYEPVSAALFVSDVLPWDGVEHDPEAAKNHGITRERQERASTSFDVDVTLEHWLAMKSIGHMDGHAVGFNVGSFDMPFVCKFLPKAAERLSYRTVDINAVAFSIADAYDQPGFSVLKERAKRSAEATLEMQGRKPQWHDAGYDAAASYYAWRYLVDQVRATRTGRIWCSNE